MSEKENLELKETFSVALSEHKKGNFENAEKMYNKILDMEPEHFGAVFLLGSLHAQIKNFHLANTLLQKAIRLNPNYAEAHYNFGNVLIAMGKEEKAIHSYQSAIKINPNYADAHNNLGNLLKKKHKTEEAIHSYKKAIEVNPNYADAYNNLGAIYMYLKKYNEAEIFYKKSLEIQPNHSFAYNNLGLIFHKVGDYKKAIIQFKKAIKINPDYAEANASLGIIYKEIGDFNNAIACYQKAVKQKPENLLYLFSLNELTNEILDVKLKSKIIAIMNKEESKNIDLAYGNFLLSNYEMKSKHYNNEFQLLLKAHSFYFKSKKNSFQNKVKYWLEDLPRIKKKMDLNNIIKKNKIDILNVNPIFIIGVPRCGSTLIEKIIGSSTKFIPIGEETSIITDVIADLAKKNHLESANIENIIYEKYQNKGLVVEESNQIFTDKSLENFYYLNLIKDIFPNAKIINCKRDILSSIVSIIKNNLVALPWAHDLENIFNYFNIYYNLVLDFEKSSPNLIFNIQYENLVNNPEIESKKLLKFCELPWDKKCLEFYKNENIISKTASNIQVRKPIYKNSLNKYLPYESFLKEYKKKYKWFN